MGKLLNILGAERTGSTLLDVMLSNGSQNFSCGEMAYWYRPIRKHNFFLDCSCGDTNCQVWKELSNYSQHQIHNRLLKEYDFVIDSSKNLVWVLDAHDYIDKSHSVINLVTYKDQDNVIFSHWKRRNDIGKYLKSYYQYYQRLLETEIPFYSVKHESLVSNASESMRFICDKLGMAYFKGKEEFWNGDHHFLFGSHGIRQQISRKQSIIYQREQKSADFYDFLEKNKSELLPNSIPIETIESRLQQRDISKSTIYINGRSATVKPAWYYYRKLKWYLKRFYPDNYRIKDVNPTSGKIT